VDVPDSSGQVVFDIFQTQGDRGGDSNRFIDYKAYLRLENSPLNTVDIHFDTPVYAWGADFQEARGAGFTKLSFDFGNGFESSEVVPYDYTFFGIISPLKAIKRIRFMAVDPYDVERLYFLNACGLVRCYSASDVYLECMHGSPIQLICYQFLS